MSLQFDGMMASGTNSLMGAGPASLMGPGHNQMMGPGPGSLMGPGPNPLMGPGPMGGMGPNPLLGPGPMGGMGPNTLMGPNPLMGPGMMGPHMPVKEIIRLNSCVLYPPPPGEYPTWIVSCINSFGQSSRMMLKLSGMYLHCLLYLSNFLQLSLIECHSILLCLGDVVFHTVLFFIFPGSCSQQFSTVDLHVS